MVIKDSCLFFMAPLRRLPNTFGLPVTVRKGHFPHVVNKPQNFFRTFPQHPEVAAYEPDTMADAAERAEFDSWYEQVEKTPFNVGRELEAYCRNDVLVLYHACREFRRRILDLTGKI